MKTYVKVLGILGVILVSITLLKFAHMVYGIAFFIIGTGLLVYFGFIRKSRGVLYDKNIPTYLEPKKQDTEELVIAMCNEDVSWVDDYAHKYKLITVYNKCGKVVKFKSLNVKVIESPNIGSCDYAYLSYIIDRYDNLPDYIEFTKGSLIPTGKYNNCLPCKTDSKDHLGNTIESLMKFKNTGHVYGNKLHKELNYSQEWHNSGYDNFGCWIKKQDFLNEEIYKRSMCNIIYGGQFGATSNQIYKTPKNIWEKLKLMQKYPREEIDHFIERTWRPLLCTPSYKLVIVAIFKNEAVAIEEWIRHYMKQGVDHFYMIDNGSTDDWESCISGFPVTVYTNTEKYKQVEHYNYFLGKVKKNSEWVMVVDLDEFMYARKEFNTIPEYLYTVDKDIGQINVKWKIFGSNGYIKQPYSIIESFTKRLNYDKKIDTSFNNIKSICRTVNLIQFGIHSHKQNGKNTPNNIDSEYQLDMCPLHLNHYAIQSLDWFTKVKMTRGDADAFNNNNVRNKQYFDKYDVNDVLDTELAKFR